MKQITAEQLRSATEMYTLQAMSTHTIGNRLGLSAETVRLALKAAGVEMRKGAAAQTGNVKGRQIVGWNR
jgi:DNA-directed RNA polymerase specialized sigma24 family protein